MKEKKLILIVDDDKNICRTLELGLTGIGYNVKTAESVNDAIRILSQESVDVLLTDFKMEKKTGKDLIAAAQIHWPTLPIIVMTAYSSIENAVEVVKEGAFDYLPKPFSLTQLEHVLQKIEKFSDITKENSLLKRMSVRKDFFTGLKTVSTQRLHEIVQTLAPTDCTILLTGESGTGKSELAKLIHELSPHAKKPFVTIYCTTLTESLIETELFGHQRGAFTGAFKDKKGKLELAENGTLFFDEVGDLSMSLQSKLLRFLQDRVFERVGGTQEIHVNTRIILATNKNLRELVQQGKFREDLYYRVNSFELEILPLRARPEDVKVLLHRLIKEAGKSLKTATEFSLPESVEDLLLAYAWPGNIRELKNIVERLLILANTKKTVTVDDLPFDLRNADLSARSDSSMVPTLEEIERCHIQKVLENEKNLEKASQLLGITSVTLWRKRKQYFLN